MLKVNDPTKMPLEHYLMGQWSTSWFYQDPVNEVLVFLPAGRGVFEYYSWSLSHYETFTYQVESEHLLIVGDKTFSYNLAQNLVEETFSTLRFSGKFWVRKTSLEEAKLGCEVILELDAPLEAMFPATNKFGRNALQGDVSNYKLPIFDKKPDIRIIGLG